MCFKYATIQCSRSRSSKTAGGVFTSEGKLKKESDAQVVEANAVLRERPFRDRKARALLRIERSQLRWFGHVTAILRERLARGVLFAHLYGGARRPRGVITSPTWLGAALVWWQQNNQRLLKTVRNFESLYGSSLATLPRIKSCTKMNE